MRTYNIAGLILLSFIYIAKSQLSCSDYKKSTLFPNPEVDCGKSTSCTWLNGKCRCASEVKLDILFGVDTSGSIGWDGFQIQKDFIKTLVTQGINNGSRIGFTMFNTDVNASRGIQEWDTNVLSNYVDHIYWTAGWTNTPELLISTLGEFASTKRDDRQQVLMMITDGNPCLPESRGGCPQSVCQYAGTVKSAGVRVIIIGVGDGLNTLYVKCLTQSDDDFIPVASFSADDFDSIMGSLSGILCPVSKEFKVTEVKAAKKDGTYNNRWGRFIEIYNTGIDFNANQLTLQGLVTGNGPDVQVKQGQYLVFYDARDRGGNPAQPSIVSCHLCGAVCDLNNCPNPTDRSLVTTSGDYCFCGNSIYVACGNTGSVAGCDVATGSQHTATDGCSIASPATPCRFTDSMTATNWNIVINDKDTNKLIDRVDYDTNTWIVTDPGYSYELISKGFDNDVGDNWAQSCSVFGTPGSDPAATCSEECSNTGCGTGGTCNSVTKLCDCDATTGYYPQCTSPTSCVRCLLVPGIDDCQVIWKKNGTARFAAFNWTKPDRDGDIFYELNFFDNNNAGGITSVGKDGNNPIFQTYYKVDNYYPGNDSYGGFVRSVITDCELQQISTQGNSCNFYYSPAVWCQVFTSSPTISPTDAPTNSPSSSPTARPTSSPTWPCPRYWWTNDKVCDPDRCYCDGRGDQCCLLEPDFSVKYDAERKHKTIYECKLDVELQKPDKRDDGESKAGSAKGYLLTTSKTPTKHYFAVDISPDNYPYTMDICWRLEFDSTDCNYKRRRMADASSSDVVCDESSTDPIRAGLRVYPRSGCLTVYGANDEKNATVEITTEQADCDEIIAYLNNGGSGSSSSGSTPNTTVTRRRRLRRSRRLLENKNCLKTVAITGNLVIENATSRGQPNCTDGRIYPMRIPVWYNYNLAFIAPPTDERELPAWLWWLIAALVVFLALLAFLVYKYWWKNKATGAALAGTQADLDAAIAEQEDGWGADLKGGGAGFNPLATGFNPNAAAGPHGPNGPPNAGGGGQEWVRPHVEKIVDRREFGPQAAGFR